MRSSATEELLDDRPHVAFDDVRRLRRADQPHTLGLGAEDFEIPLAHAPMEDELFALEVVQTPPADSPKSLGGIEIEQHGEVGHDAARRAGIQLTDQIAIDAATVALIGNRRVRIAIAEHDAVALEPRPDLLGHVLLTRRHEEEYFDERLRLHAGTLEEAAHRDAEPSPVRLARVLHLPPLPTKPSPEPHHLGRLARPFDALERNQCAAHVRPQPPEQP